jgi:hypothetical protein
MKLLKLMQELSPDVLGSAAFTPVKNDLLGNIEVGPIHSS